MYSPDFSFFFFLRGLVCVPGFTGNGVCSRFTGDGVCSGISGDDVCSGFCGG